MYRILKKVDGFKNSFLEHTLLQTPKYGFVPHLIYFLKRKDRWANSDIILQRIFAEVPADSMQAWEVWRQYRSAQAEVTSIYLIENYLTGEVREIEVDRPGIKKRCDIHVAFHDDVDFYFEVKAQSGQQHGDKHRISDDLIGFCPQFEDDLYSWLFEEKISTQNGQPMRPMCLQASDKRADVLLAMTDIFFQKNTNLSSLVKFITPDFTDMHIKVFRREYSKMRSLNNLTGAVLQWLRIKNDIIRVIAVTAGEETVRKMGSLKEVWVFDNSALGEIIVIRRPKQRLDVLPAPI